MSFVLMGVLGATLVSAPMTVAEQSAMAFLNRVGIKSAKIVEKQDFRGRGTIVRFEAGTVRCGVLVDKDGKRILSFRRRGAFTKSGPEGEKSRAMELAKSKFMNLLPRKDVRLDLQVNGGQASAKYDLMLSGYPVWGNGYSVDFDIRSGTLLGYRDEVERVLPDITKPKISAEQAFKSAQTHALNKAGRDRNAQNPVKVTFSNPKPTLGYMMSDTGAQLAYRFERITYPLRPGIKGVKGPGIIYFIFVSAKNGAVQENTGKVGSAPMMQPG